MQIDFSHILVIAIFGFLFLKRKRLDSAEEQKTKEQIQKIEVSEKETSTAIQEEQKNREAITNEMRKKINEVLDEKTIAEFFNNRK
jgi:hypothetical protein